MTETQIAFIGVGNMASAMISGMRKGGFPAGHIRCHRRNLAAITELGQQGMRLCSRLGEAVEGAQLVVLAVKPWQTLELAAQCATHLGRDTMLVSLAAGIHHNQLADQAPDASIVRLMPNTPVAVGQGVIGCYSKKQQLVQSRINQAFGALGMLVWLHDEEHMHAITALAGCGPAYYFRLLKHMHTLAQELGLSDHLAAKLVLQTLVGAGALASQSPNPDFASLTGQIVSTGSATGLALQTFAEHGLQECLSAGVHAAARRSRELANYRPD